MSNVNNHFSLKDPRFGSLIIETVVPVENDTDAAQTYTAAQLLSGFIIRQVGTGRTDTLPTAALLVAAIQGVMVGHSFNFRVRNTSSSSVNITVAAGTGGTFGGTISGIHYGTQTATIAQNADRMFKVIFTNVTAGSEAYTLLSLGGGAF